MSIKLDYDAATRTAVFTYGSGRVTRVGNVSEEKAKQMLERVMPEWERRDGCLTSTGGYFTREEDSGG